MKLINRLFIILISCLLSSVALAKDLTVGLKSEPSSIDPHYHNLGPNNAFATHIFGTPKWVENTLKPPPNGPKVDQKWVQWAG